MPEGIVKTSNVNLRHQRRRSRDWSSTWQSAERGKVCVETKCDCVAVSWFESEEEFKLFQMQEGGRKSSASTSDHVQEQERATWKFKRQNAKGECHNAKGRQQ